jgi:hypothetical protein
MDKENKSIDCLDKVPQYVKAHPSVALGLAILVILAISFSGFLELLKIVFSPQIVICGLVLYFLATFKAEVARLIDRIKEVNALGASIKTDGPIPTPEDKENRPQPEMKVSETQDTEIHIGVGGPGAREPINEDLIKAQRQATYWFFKYLFSELTPATIWSLKVIGKRPVCREDFDLRESKLLEILAGFGLIRMEGDKLDITGLGEAFLDFCQQETLLKWAAAGQADEDQSQE